MLEKEEFVDPTVILGDLAKNDADSDVNSEEENKNRVKTSKALQQAVDNLESSRLLRSQMDGSGYQNVVKKLNFNC